MVEVKCRDGCISKHTRGTPKQMGSRAGAHVVSKQVLIILATNSLNVTCQDASRIHSSIDEDLPEGTASHCQALLKLSLSRFIAPD